MLNQQLVLGRTYRIKFKSVFVNHGAGSEACLHKGGGVFRLEQIASFRDILTAGIKLYENFFEPVGETKEEYAKYFDSKPDDLYEPTYTEQQVPVEVTRVSYETQIINGVSTSVPVNTVVTEYRTELVPSAETVLKKEYTNISYSKFPIYKLVDIANEQDILYAPELAIDGFPEVDINQYADITLAIRLGCFQETGLLEPMLQAVKDKLALYGVYYDNVNLIVTDNKWMSTEEYEEIVSDRMPGVRTRLTDANMSTYLNKIIIEDGVVKTLDSALFNAYKVTQVTLNASNKASHIGKTFEYDVDPSAAEIKKTVVLDADNIDSLIGTTGIVYKDVYVSSSIASDRNYYYLYELEKKRSNRLAAQIAALEEIITSNAIHVN